MDKVFVGTKLKFYAEMGLTPTLLFYGDSVWKRGWLGFKLIPHPSGKVYGEPPRPDFKTKIGGYLTQSRDGNVLPGIGVVAANLTEIDGDLAANFDMILNIDPDIEGVAILDKSGEIVDWIGREHGTGI